MFFVQLKSKEVNRMPGGKNMNTTIAREVYHGLTDGEKKRFKAGDLENLSDAPGPWKKNSEEHGDTRGFC